MTMFVYVCLAHSILGEGGGVRKLYLEVIDLKKMRPFPCDNVGFQTNSSEGTYWIEDILSIRLRPDLDGRNKGL